VAARKSYRGGEWSARKNIGLDTRKIKYFITGEGWGEKRVFTRRDQSTEQRKHKTWVPGDEIPTSTTVRKCAEHHICKINLKLRRRKRTSKIYLEKEERWERTWLGVVHSHFCALKI
jgi:hypothetical protein